jgi:hypothetical protein
MLDFSIVSKANTPHPLSPVQKMINLGARKNLFLTQKPTSWLFP